METIIVKRELTNQKEEVMFEGFAKVNVKNYWDSHGKLIPYNKENDIVSKEPVKIKLIKKTWTEMNEDYEDVALTIEGTSPEKTSGSVYSVKTMQSGVKNIKLVVGWG